MIIQLILLTAVLRNNVRYLIRYSIEVILFMINLSISVDNIVMTRRWR